MHHVTVVRGSLTHPEIAVVDYRNVLKGLAPDFPLQPGDIVQEVNRKSVKTAVEFRNAVSTPTVVILLSVNRGGHNLYMVVERRA